MAASTAMKWAWEKLVRGEFINARSGWAWRKRTPYDLTQRIILSPAEAIVLMLCLRKQGKGPFLVVSPLSVCDHWISEVTRFSCGTLNPIGYYGVEKERKALLKEIKKLQRNSVFIVPYHVFRDDSEIIAKLEKKSKLTFDVVIVDEAQAIKNSETQLANKLKPYRGYAWFLLMTGTPLQNHLGELYSLLTFVDPKRFKDRISAKEDFMELYKKDEKLSELRKILSRYMIRRTKDVVCKELPSCEQVIIYHNMTELQKKIYLDLISEHYSKFESFSDFIFKSSFFFNELMHFSVSNPSLLPNNAKNRSPWEQMLGDRC
ncbi:unnamed protein product [Haemonchus placei]|uniref:Helicase ATP-binding domain-containing protein n=1 Tax=Haemonchus placei TaxID=6290 RepID=A0A0N4VTD4_HAEPC|nr:unnamed protein product [Haemonchus placei]